MTQKYYLMLKQAGSDHAGNAWFVGFGDGPPDPSGAEPTDIVNPSYTYWGPDQQPLPSFTADQIARLSARLPTGNEFLPVEVEHYGRKLSATRN